MNPVIYIVGRICAFTEAGHVWEILGAFTDEEAAQKACKDSFCFVGPVVLDQVLPEEVMIWPGAYYPLCV